MTSVVGTTPVVRVGRGPYVAALLVALVSALVLLNPDVALGAQPSFLPAFFTLIVVMDVLTCLVLLGHYRTGGSPRALALSLAYLWSAIIVTVHRRTSCRGSSSRGPAPTAPTPTAPAWVSVVHELVERQGGTVHYEPEGNRFVVRLPSARMAPAGGAAAAPVGYPASPAASSATAST